jgi:hypothetical protein
MLVNFTSAYAQVFNYVPLTEEELNLAVERGFAMGLTSGFSGIRPYSKIELLNLYHETQDEYLLKYIRKDLMEIGASPDGKTAPSGFYLEPISYLQTKAYIFDTDIDGKEKYCIENMEGTCLDDGFSSFTNLVGQGRLHRNVTFFYEGQLKVGEEETRGILKKAYIKIKTGKVVWEFGKDSIWIGHGRHGSFLLSSNAEPFLLFKLDTEEPFRLPFFLNKAGEFKYTFFHGWLDDFNILGHRLAWKPVSILELGANQTVVYDQDKGIEVWDWPRIFVNSQENLGGKFDNDQRGSLDLALYMPFLKKVPYAGLKGGKLYAEYGGEDTYAWWQEEDGTWYGPLGFEFLGQGIIMGLFLTTGKTDFRFEYAENYRSYPILYNWYDDVGVDYPSKGELWYQGPPFLNRGVIMGHHIGPESLDVYYEIRHRFSDELIVSGFYDRQRHHLYNKIDQFNIFPTTPEKRYQYGLDALYSLKKFEFSGTFIYNKYENLDTNVDPLRFNIVKGKEAEEFIASLGIRYIF